MIKNRKKSRAPFVIGGVILAAGAVLIYLNFNPVRRQPREEYFPSGSLREAPGMEFSYDSVGDLGLSYAFWQTPYRAKIPSAGYMQLSCGVGAKINGSQYVYAGAYGESSSALAAVLDDVPLLFGEGYNRNGSHAKVLSSSEGYINEYHAGYEFILLSADFSGSFKDYYAAFYEVDTPDEGYSICICSVTEGKNDGAKDMCVKWIDAIAATLSVNDSFAYAKEPDEKDEAVASESPGEGSIYEDSMQIEEILPDEAVAKADEEEKAEDMPEEEVHPGSQGTAGAPLGNESSTGSTQKEEGMALGNDAGESRPPANEQAVEPQPAPEPEPVPEPPAQPQIPAYDGAADVDHNSFDSPFSGAYMTVSVWTQNAADGCVCTMTCPDGTTVLGSGGGTSFSFAVTSQEGMYTVNISHASRIGSWGASISFGG